MTVINKFQTLFELINLIFSSLRILSPSRNEIKRTEESIRKLEEIWRDMELSESPKIHLLFNHVMFQIKEFSGIADMTEDFAEKVNHEGKKLDHLAARINSKSC